MSDIDLTRLTLSEAAALIGARELSPVELTEACIERAQRLDGRLHAFFTPTFETALDEAKAAEAEIAAGRYRGPLHGVPIALKDLYETAGVRTTAGSPFRDAYVPEHDAFVVTRLKAAGAVFLGKLNMHEWALGPTNLNAFYPSPRNPWDNDRITGGSSGGSALAVAAGFCIGALGSDSRGSIRIPASFCGVSGLKATYGRVSVRGVVPLFWSLDHAGPLARTATDCALILQAIAGYDEADPLCVDKPVDDYSAELAETRLAGVRIGVPDRFFFDEDVVQPDVLEAVRAAAEDFRRLGATVEPVEFPTMGVFTDGLSFIAEAAALHEERLRESPDGFSQLVRARLDIGMAEPATDYVKGVQAQLRFKRELQRVFRDVDLLLTPTTPIVALTFNEAKTALPATLLRNTGPFNVTGSPVVSVPCGFDSAGMPIGLSLTGRDWEEALLVRAANAYQQTTDWHLRTPKGLRPA